MQPSDTGIEPQDMKVDESAEPGLLLEVWDWIKAVIVAMIVVVILHQYGFHLSTVKGISMEPTLTEGEWLFINKTIRYAGTPERGDIVVVRDPSGLDSTHPFLVKRIVAVAGDEVHVRRGKLFVNGKEVKESYVHSPIQDGSFEPTRVMKGYVFVMGDNRHRNASHDSRTFGPVSVEQVEGRAEWIVWPVDKWGRL